MRADVPVYSLVTIYAYLFLQIDLFAHALMATQKPEPDVFKQVDCLKNVFVKQDLSNMSQTSCQVFFFSTFVDDNATFIQPQAKSDFSSSKYITCEYKTLLLPK